MDVVNVISRTSLSRLLKEVYEGTKGTAKLPQPYYLDQSRRYIGGLRKGFGVKGKTSPYYAKFVEMAQQAQLFAGAKTYQLMRELESLKASGLSWVDYKQEGIDVWEKYERWAKTERATMQQIAKQMRAWDKAQKQKANFPNLRYVCHESACEICRPLNGTVAPVDSDFWKQYYPPLHYSCNCIAAQEGAGVTPNSESELDAVIRQIAPHTSEIFTDNPAVSGDLLNGHHPYFDVPKRDRAKARRNFDLPIVKPKK